MQITPHGDNFYLSSIGGEQALTPPKRHCLGRPLPYQLADTEQAAPKASSPRRGGVKLYSSAYASETIGNYLRFRGAMPDFRVRTCLLLPRLPLTAHSAETPSSNIQAPNKSQ